MLAITLLGSIFYILFKILEKFLKNNLTSNIYYKLSKIIALAFIIPISYILSLYLPDFNSINFNKFYKQNEPIQQTITESITSTNNNTSSNIISENTITKANTLNKNINMNNEKEINTNIDNIKVNINYNLIFKTIYILGLILFIFVNFIFFIKFKITINKSNIILDENYNNILNKVKQNLNINKNIFLFENKTIFSPMLVSILNPKIILPKKNIPLQDLEFILTHELIHFKRKDLLTKLILLLINILNFFNPLIYLLIKDIDKWCEYSCDEKLIKIYNNNQKNYCLAILNCLNPSKKTNIHFSTTFACNKNNLKRRLENIMSENKPKNKLKITLICSFFTFACAVFILAFSIFYSNNKVDALAKENNEIERTFDESIYLNSGNRPSINYEEVPMTTEILPEEKERQLIPEILLKGTFKKEEPSTGSMELDFITRRFYNDTTYSTDKYIKIDLENIEQLSYDPKNVLNLSCRISGKYIDKFTGEIKEVYLGKFAVPKNEKRTFVFEAIPDIYAYKLKFQLPASYAPSFNLEVTAGYILESLGVDNISTTTFEETIPLIYTDSQRLNNVHKNPNSTYREYVEGGAGGTRTYKLQSGFYNNLNLKLENKSNDEYTLFVYDKSVDVFKEEYMGSPSTLYKEYTIQPNSTLAENFTNALVKEYEVHIVPSALKDTYLELHNFIQEVYDTYKKNGKEDKKADKLYDEYKNKEKKYRIEYEKYLANQKGSITYKFTK